MCEAVQKKRPVRQRISRKVQFNTLCIEKYQDAIILEGKAYVDETYLSVMPKDLDRKDGKKLRGLSRNKLCIVTATDGSRTFIAYIGNGKPSAKRLIEGLGNHIKPGTLIVDDGEKSHAALCRKLNSERESHPGLTTKGLPDDRNPLDPVNEVHRFFKRLMRNHGGYKRDEVKVWSNLFRSSGITMGNCRKWYTT